MVNVDERINVTFDFRSDTPGYPKADPDAVSPTLRRYHKKLWSKPLPGGSSFHLVDTRPRAYLHHSSELGEFWLASDTVIPSFRKEQRIAHVLEAIPDEVAAFVTLGYTMGAMMLFPGDVRDRKMTINGARGFHPRIKDRFDHTIECVRRHYLNEPSPLSAVLLRYADFFALFRDFPGFVDFFLLQDLVADDYSAVRFFSPFENFTTSPIPASLDAYRAYRDRASQFIEQRNHRIRVSQEQDAPQLSL